MFKYLCQIVTNRSFHDVLLVIHSKHKIKKLTLHQCDYVYAIQEKLQRRAADTEANIEDTMRKAETLDGTERVFHITQCCT